MRMVLVCLLLFLGKDNKFEGNGFWKLFKRGKVLSYRLGKTTKSMCGLTGFSVDLKLERFLFL